MTAVVEHGAIAEIDGVRHQGAKGTLDITGADDITIEIRNDGKVLWINMPSCVFRVCCIRGGIEIVDRRTERQE
jgi:hypothetical protein